jgi:acyl carrier protein
VTGGELLALVHAAIDDHNSLAATPVAKAGNTVLYGAGGALDSIALVNLIIALEQHVLDRIGIALALADDRAFSQARSPFRTVASLVEYVGERIAEAQR